jgi:hypothetical protein
VIVARFTLTFEAADNPQNVADSLVPSVLVLSIAKSPALTVISRSR